VRPLAAILMGSKSDLPTAQQIAAVLRKLGVESLARIASAHKTTQRLLEIVREIEGMGRPTVFITVAGRSNALSGVVDANTVYPTIACPPYSDRFSGMDVLSSLRMPSAVAPVTVLEPEAAALAAAKILALSDASLKGRLEQYRVSEIQRIEEADREIRHQWDNEGA
jgi:5-(carboxyamino)imidazole ribonucleotide mutase